MGEIPFSCLFDNWSRAARIRIRTARSCCCWGSMTWRGREYEAIAVSAREMNHVMCLVGRRG